MKEKFTKYAGFDDHLKVWAFTLFFNSYIEFNFANFLAVFSF